MALDPVTDAPALTVKLLVTANAPPKAYVPPEPQTVSALNVAPLGMSARLLAVPDRVTAPVPENVPPVLRKLPPTFSVLDPSTVPVPIVNVSVVTSASLKVCDPPALDAGSPLPASVLIWLAVSARL